MSCFLEFPESLVKIEFCSKGKKQRILIETLTKYSEMDFNKLASVLGVSVMRLKYICKGEGFLVGEQADSLAQLFLIFLGKHFFRNCKLIRSFVLRE
ncbi:hypothetical protein E3226_007150 [Legionella geestiana]|uniref:hypothetical protein n=1 Tax=Legionella geestiana TaxID=45065 RepID=UPI001092B271|nr:hypothetical protein [Legionella geestiana]QDQ40190.1 hypothetical protein E3226_007150 [Legionella geestiana]